MRWLLLIPLLLISACSSNPTPPAAQAQSAPEAPIEAPISDGEEPGSKRSVKIAIVISRMEDLQVKEGDFIAKGQIIADRTRERAQLASEKSLLIQKIEKLSAPSIPALNRSPLPPIANLPPPSFIEIHSEIQAKRLQVQEAERLARTQQRKIDMLNALPPGDLPPETLKHELEQLAATQRRITEAEAAIAQSEAKLSTAQIDRQQLEYTHSLKLAEVAEREQQRELERNRQAQEYQRQERDREFQIAQLQTQLQSLDEKIKDVSAILSNHTGKIRKIRIAKQDNTGLHVDIQLSITGKTNDRNSKTNANDSTNANTEGFTTQSTQTSTD
jgi:multidrug efflux pump subunit AcrA (membrane-fusion protein)